MTDLTMGLVGKPRCTGYDGEGNRGQDYRWEGNRTEDCQGEVNRGEDYQGECHVNMVM